MSFYVYVYNYPYWIKWKCVQGSDRNFTTLFFYVFFLKYLIEFSLYFRYDYINMVPNFYVPSGQPAIYQTEVFYFDSEIQIWLAF